MRHCRPIYRNNTPPPFFNIKILGLKRVIWHTLIDSRDKKVSVTSSVPLFTSKNIQIPGFLVDLLRLRKVCSIHMWWLFLSGGSRQKYLWPAFGMQHPIFLVFVCPRKKWEEKNPHIFKRFSGKFSNPGVLAWLGCSRPFYFGLMHSSSSSENLVFVKKD